MTLRVAIPDMVSPSYFPAIAAVELGYFDQEGLDATIELIYPVTDTYAKLREGAVDYVGGAAHAALHEFQDWEGVRLLCALSQHMYWFLVVRADLDATRGDLQALRGLRIGAAPGPVDGLRRMVAADGLDPEQDMEIGPVPGTSGTGVSFGVTAAKALKERRIDAFWANGMGAEVALRNGSGHLLVDARRGDGPAGAEDYTFAALVGAAANIEQRPAQTAAAVRAIVRAQQALTREPGLATQACASHFPEFERSLIAELIRRDAPFYDPAISQHSVEALNDFSRQLGLLSNHDVSYEEVVATSLTKEWTR